MSVALSMLRVIKTVQLKLIVMNVMVSSILEVLSFFNTSVDADVTTPDHRDRNINIRNNV